jgi:hypothetical protein
MPEVEVVGWVLISVGFALSMLAFAMVVRRRRDAAELASAIRSLRERYGLDRQRWTEVRRSAHRGTAAPEPLREASRAYATAVLDTPGHGAGPAELALISIAGLLTSTGILLDQIADGRFIWLTVAAILLTAAALATYLVLRRRRPARAMAALAANR